MSSVTEPFARARVFLRGLSVEAEIGVNPDEMGRRQVLIVDIEAELEGEPWRGIGHTVDYDDLARRARDLAAAGHIGLIETFAWRLARACLEASRVLAVRVRVEKPEALAPAHAGAEIELRRVA
ncbi:MAG: dihydroneopterin aldolase [Alphaproteobacteria bacterium]|jgi:dihydroneopterin aldolase|nr:dihydroneopterin aldolase [Alphaproteobacteria bacterium]